MCGHEPGHPPPERLRAFALGRLDESEASQVEEHLSVCEACCLTAATAPEDTLAVMVRMLQSDSDPAPEGASSPDRSETPADSPDASAFVAPGPAQTSPELPGQFGRYRILRRLKSGGMGTVHLAHDSELDRDVALKVPHRSSQGNAEWRDRFRREVRAAAALEHPNICPVYDVGEVDGTLFMTMAFVEGESLAERLAREGQVPVEEAVRLVPHGRRGDAGSPRSSGLPSRSETREHLAKPAWRAGDCGLWTGRLAHRDGPPPDPARDPAGDSSVHESRASAWRSGGNWTRSRRLQPGRNPVRDARWPSAVW